MKTDVVKNGGSMPTVTEVAREANVSRAVVYAVLNAQKKTNIGVSKEKKQHVIKVAKKLGYVRNEAARALVMGKTYSIGVIVNTLKTGFYAEFFSSLDDACSIDNYSVLIGTSENSKTREAKNLRMMFAKRIDAVVLARIHPDYNSDSLDLFLERGIPVVIMGEADIPHQKYFQVAFDEPEIGTIASKHLWSLGHRKVAYFSAEDQNDLTTQVYTTRYNDFAKKWKKLGGTFQGFTSKDVTHGGNELAEKLLASNYHPTAIACSCDTLAISAMHALHTRGIKIPEDISIIGCDDIDIASETFIPLTTIRLPRNELGKNVWSVLQDVLVTTEENADNKTPKRILVKPELIVRQSTKEVNL